MSSSHKATGKGNHSNLQRLYRECIRPRYRDTSDGVLSYLRHDSNLDLRKENIRSITPDPSVEGVWEVMLSDTQVIVYLAGYKDPWGEIRKTDDFETAELTHG